MFDKKKYNKEYREKNKKKILQKNSDWKKANPEKVKIQSKKYYKKNSEKLLEYHKNYKKKYPEKRKLADKKYYEKNKTNPIFYLKKKYLSILDRTANKKNYKNRICNFTLNEFILFAQTKSNFYQLFSAWQKSGFEHKKAPSVDRRNNDGNYTLDNIQFLTTSENSKKGQS